MEGIKNSVLSNSILFPLNTKTKKNQSNINLDYMNEIAKLPYDSNEDENYDNIYIQKNKLENIYNDIYDKIKNLQTNTKEKKTWMNNDIILEIFFYLGKLDNILENSKNYNYISIIKKNLSNNNFTAALENLIFLKKI